MTDDSAETRGRHTYVEPFVRVLDLESTEGQRRAYVKPFVRLLDSLDTQGAKPGIAPSEHITSTPNSGYSVTVGPS